MDTLNFIVKLVGPIFMIVGIGIMTNKKMIIKIADEITSSATAIFIAGFLSILIGLIILLSNFGFNTIPESIVSILGLGATLKGTLLIILPKHMKKMTKHMMKSIKDLTPVIGFLYLLIGLYLCWMGY